MLSTKVTWNLKTVMLVHLSRIVAGIILIRFLYPLFFTVSSTVVDITDRVVIVLLVWYFLKRYNTSFSQAGLSAHNLGRNLLIGLAVGGILLGISIFSERLYTSLLFVTASEHPLVAQVKTAATWQDLAIPLILAGITAPVAEEVLYRLFTFLPFKAEWGLWRGAFASAVVFAFMHFNLFWLAEMIIVGMGLALIYYWSGSLVSAIVAHSLINSAKIIFIFLGIPII